MVNLKNNNNTPKDITSNSSGKKKLVNKKKGKYFLSSDKEGELINDLKSKQIQIDVQKLEIHQLKDQLKKLKNKYTELFNFSPIGYISLNDNGLVIESNLIASVILGIEKRFLYNIPFINLLETSDTKRFINGLKSCRNHNSQMLDEFTIHNKKKGTLMVQINALPVIDNDTKKITYRLSLNDITEKKKIMEELKESEKRFRLMSDSSPAMIWMFDENNMLIYLNNKSLQFYGNSLENLAEMWFQQTHPDDKEKFNSAFSEAFNEKKSFDVEIRRKNKNGDYRWIYNSAAPRFLPDGKFLGYIGIGIDISESKKLREELENSLKEKEILLKEIHHRVKNNLQIISSILSLQTHYLNNKPVTDVLNECRDRVLSLSLLHEQLYGSNNFSNINFENFVRILVNHLICTYNYLSEKISFNIDINDLKLSIETSINLGLILNELVTNSLKYAFKGRENGTIDISLKSENEKIIFKVSDNGKGLPEDFDINRLKSLGFELVNSLVEQLRGELKILNKGKTEFQVIIPKDEQQ